MIGVFVNDDVIACPIPTIAKSDIIRRDAEIESTKPEPCRTAAREVPHMFAAKSRSEMPMLPGMIEVIVRIIRPTVMPDPLVIGMDVRRVRMSWLIRVIRTGFFRWISRSWVTVLVRGSGRMLCGPGRTRPMRGDVLLLGMSCIGMTLRSDGCRRDYASRAEQTDGEKSGDGLQRFLLRGSFPSQEGLLLRKFIASNGKKIVHKEDEVPPADCAIKRIL